MRYLKAIDVWAIPGPQRAGLQAGQWVLAGDSPDAAKGQYLGQTRAGVDVVAWLHNLPRNPIARRGYIRALRQYAEN